jgi:hypothetical protein
MNFIPPKARILPLIFYLSKYRQTLFHPESLSSTFPLISLVCQRRVSKAPFPRDSRGKTCACLVISTKTPRPFPPTCHSWDSTSTTI